MLNYIKFKTQIFFFSLHADLICLAIYIFRKRLQRNFSIFFVYFLRMCEIIRTFAADFENDITIVN